MNPPPFPFSGARTASGETGVPDRFPSGINFGRRASVSAESTTTQASTSSARCTHTPTPKTDDQLQRIRSATSDVFLFRNLETEQYEAALLAMAEVHKHAGDIVIKQGDQGDYFYVVEDGTLDVYIQPPGTPASDALAAPATQLGHKTMTYGSGASFGELALMYLQPRAASVVAASACTLWTVDRVTFRSILTEADMSRRAIFAAFLKQVPLLSHLSDAERLRVLDAIDVQDYQPGDVVVREGDLGSHFFMVANGVADVYKAGDDAHPVSKLQRGDYFGELALMHRAPRAATVRALTRLRVAVLEEQAFTRLLGPLSDLMARHAEQHYRSSATPKPTHAAASLAAGEKDEPGSPRSGR